MNNEKINYNLSKIKNINQEIEQNHASHHCKNLDIEILSKSKNNN